MVPIPSGIWRRETVPEPQTEEIQSIWRCFFISIEENTGDIGLERGRSNLHSRLEEDSREAGGNASTYFRRSLGVSC